jgi:hypothetical protein
MIKNIKAQEAEKFKEKLALRKATLRQGPFAGSHVSQGSYKRSSQGSFH